MQTNLAACATLFYHFIILAFPRTQVFYRFIPSVPFLIGTGQRDYATPPSTGICETRYIPALNYARVEIRNVRANGEQSIRLTDHLRKPLRPK